MVLMFYCHASFPGGGGRFMVNVGKYSIHGGSGNTTIGLANLQVKCLLKPQVLSGSFVFNKNVYSRTSPAIGANEK